MVTSQCIWCRETLNLESLSGTVESFSQRSFQSVLLLNRKATKKKKEKQQQMTVNLVCPQLS